MISVIFFGTIILEFRPQSNPQPPASAGNKKICSLYHAIRTYDENGYNNKEN